MEEALPAQAAAEKLASPSYNKLDTRRHVPHGLAEQLR